MTMLRVELFFDDEAGNWHYRVPALHINGGGTATRAEAEHECLSAIAFALEGDPEDYDPAAETVTPDVRVAPAAWSGDSGHRQACAQGPTPEIRSTVMCVM